ncbi:MAG: hypothetical protein M1812_006977 [Candelaria pacifica]|nr:MAG: hypothetical protein M1812_006977 [Candelaria pacifica]
MTEAGNKENMTVDLGSTKSGKRGSSSKPPAKKLRSKSIGPGGLDALNEDSGNRGEAAVAPIVRSILKPTIAFSPLRPIPSRRIPAKDEAGRAIIHAVPLPPSDGLLIDVSVPDNSPSKAAAPVLGVSTLSNPFDVAEAPSLPTKVTLKTEEEQQAAVKERDDKERLEREQQDLVERRNARRKSLANRRVSFAPEATLHMWDVVEYVQDSTTSSASTNSTRRASSLSAAASLGASSHLQSPAPNSDASEPPSTPPKQVEEIDPGSSPAHQRDLHQKKRRRRSSGIPPMNFNNPYDGGELSSSPYSGSSAAGSEDSTIQAPLDGHDSSSSDGESDQEGGSTMMSIDADGNTNQSIASIVSRASSTGSAGRLEEALRQAARQAGTQGIEYDEHGDLTMEMADDEVTTAFQPWVHKGVEPKSRLQVLQEQENSNPFSPAFRAGTARNSPEASKEQTDGDEEMSMDITRVVGGILPPQSGQETFAIEKTPFDEASFVGDETMDFTTAIGGIQKQLQLKSQEDDVSEKDDNEDLTMELTAVVGGLQEESPINNIKRAPSPKPETPKRKPRVSLDDTGEIIANSQPATPKSRTAMIKEGLMATPRSALKNSAKVTTPKRITPGKREALATPSKTTGSASTTPKSQGWALRFTPKQVQEREGSPVKRIKLPAPPSKVETTGRMTRAMRRSLGETTGNPQPATPTSDTSQRRKGKVTTPKLQRTPPSTAPSLASNKTSPDVNNLQDADRPQAPVEEEDQRIHLQDFLNMTSIRFMELTTTKRRHTMAPVAVNEGEAKLSDALDSLPAAAGPNVEPGQALENCVVAGACTVPMLDLYQHSCHELKKYISEGRIIAREIEADTFEENPPLFRDYVSASPEVKTIMDNQFKNVKTHARLLSKAMWYEWRMKLLQGLREGLIRVAEDMEGDEALLREQEQILAAVLPRLVRNHERMSVESEGLQAQADELASCDQEELLGARQKLTYLEEEIEAKKSTVRHLQEQLREKEEGIEAVSERKQECIEEIKEAERVREECRGWSVNEVSVLKADVDMLREKYGWSIASASESTLTMIYRDQIQLFFDVASFQPNNSFGKAEKKENSPISLTYIADSNEFHAEPLSTEKRFFLQNMRAQLQCMRQGGTRVKDLLMFVSDNWAKACVVAEEIRCLDVSQMTDSVILSDEVLNAKSALFLPTLKSKVEISFLISISSSATALSISAAPQARVVYGERFNEQKMREFLACHINERIDGKEDNGSGNWSKAVIELRGKLLSKGKKG